jgi:O-antigen ligase
VLAAWALFAFAGAYRWTLVPLAIGAAALASISPPRLFRSHRWLDGALLACLFVTAAQAVPLPAGLRLALSPASAAADRAILFTVAAADGTGVRRPLSMEPDATLWAVAFGAIMLVIFWGARSWFERAGGLRHLARGLAWLGLLLAGVVFVQRAVSPNLIYGFWRPIARIDHPHPIGPFLNRNDLATWLIMAVPVVLAYGLARIESRRRAAAGPGAAEEMFDSRMVLIAISSCLMVATLLATVSRSGLLGLTVSIVCLLALVWRRLSRRAVGGALAAVTAVVGIATTYASTSAIAERVGSVFATQLGGRPAVWRETGAIVRDFAWAGVGVGAFDRAMSLYQQSTHLIFFNHAHNQYLQFLVEGGLLLAVPAGVALVAGAVEVWRRMRGDTSPMFWVRAGSASALAAVAAQSIWDTGLRMPANAVLFAILAAAALHAPEKSSPDGQASPTVS